MTTMLLKQPPKSKSNPNGLKGCNMGIFFKQKLTKERMESAIKTGHIVSIDLYKLPPL